MCNFIGAIHEVKIDLIKDIAAAVSIALFAWVLVPGFEVDEMLRGLT